MRLLLTAALACLLALSSAGLMLIRSAQTKEQAAFEALTEPTPLPIAAERPAATTPDVLSPPTPLPAAPVPENAERFAGLIAENSDFAAWLRIDGTAIDYPVMRSPDEPDFYLHHDFAKQESMSGTPYIGKGCDLGSDNIILYGHNMKNGTMFADLLRFADADFCREHRTVGFDTVEESAEYEILAAFRERVHRQDEVGVFRYYDYTGTLTEAEFNAYVEQIKALSLYDFGTGAAYGDQLLTLSTCAYHTENGRFVIVAVKHTEA